VPDITAAQPVKAKHRSACSKLAIDPLEMTGTDNAAATSRTARQSAGP